MEGIQTKKPFTGGGGERQKWLFSGPTQNSAKLFNAGQANSCLCQLLVHFGKSCIIVIYRTLVVNKYFAVSQCAHA